MGETKDTYEAGTEVDALLAELRNDPDELIDTLNRMSENDLASFRRHLHHLQRFAGIVAVAKAGISPAALS